MFVRDAAFVAGGDTQPEIAGDAVRPDRRARSWTAWALGGLLIFIVACRFSQPIEDGDIFWHMAYGSQMADHHTLRVDHSLYSWMPASNQTVYCAWTGELLFLAAWKVLGLAGLFALRYATVLAVLGLLALHARRCGVLARPETLLAMLVMALASVVATLPKPEMLSLVLWNALVFCWFGLLLARERGRNLLPWIYAAPCIVLVWVNTHGGFILAAPFIVITGITGLLTLPRREALHVARAAGLCLVAPMVNPYGPRYPLQLISETLGFTSRPDIAWNNAFQPTFGAAGQYYHLPEFLAWMALGLAAACCLRRKGRLAVVALFLAYVPLYLIYVRSTFPLPAIFAYGVIHLSRGAQPFAHAGLAWQARLRRLGGPLAAVLFLWFGGRALYAAHSHPQTDAWLGFGIAYSQPVDEAEFLAHGHFGPRIYNTYNAGGYLLWRLYPRYKVMVDARSFPYVSWFDELRDFSLSRSMYPFLAFLSRHPADVALADFEQDAVWRSFLNTPGWRPVFYGPSAAVFAPGATGEPVRSAQSLRHMRNGAAAVKVFDFAIAVSDYRTAWDILDQLQGPLRGQVDRGELERMRNYRDGHAALHTHDYQRAWDRFGASFRNHSIDGRDNTILLILKALVAIPADDPRAPKLREGLAHLVGQP
jgi:hypothetical protein